MTNMLQHMIDHDDAVTLEPGQDDDDDDAVGDDDDDGNSDQCKLINHDK